MSETLTLDTIKEAISTRDKQRDDEFQGKLKAEIKQILKAKEPDEVLKKEEVEQKQLGGIMTTEIAGIPVGKALIGGGVALLISELVDGIIGGTIKEKVGEDWAEAVIKGGSAWAVKAWGAGIIGQPAADAAALFLAFDAIRSIIPIDDWISGLFKKKEEEESESKGSTSHRESSTGGNGHQPDAMTTLRTSLAMGGR